MSPQQSEHGNAQPLRVAVIEDYKEISDQLRDWIRAAHTNAQVTQLYTRDAAVEAVKANHYDVITLDLDLSRDRNAGVAIMDALHTSGKRTPVLVVSGMPADLYRGVMKALDAWDYLQQPVAEYDFVQTFNDILRKTKAISANKAAKDSDPLVMNPLEQSTPLFDDKPLDLPLAAQRILNVIYQKKGDTATYAEIFAKITTGKNKENLRKHIQNIRDAFREIDETFDPIERVPMKGFRWVDPTGRVKASAD